MIRSSPLASSSTSTEAPGTYPRASNSRGGLCAIAPRTSRACCRVLLSAAQLWPRLKNQIERRFGRTANACEAPLFEHLCQPRLARLRSQREANLLGERRRGADHRRRAVEDAPHRIEVLLDAIARKRLDDHPRPVGRQRC